MDDINILKLSQDSNINPTYFINQNTWNAR